jgi:hypothetical protein
MKSFLTVIGIIFAIALLAFGVGCSDEPTDIGRSLISPEDTLRVDSLTSRGTADTTFLYHSIGNPNSLFGKYGDIEARTLMQFTGFASIPTNVQVDSAVVEIPITYAFKDTTGTVAAVVYEMVDAWSQSTYTWDSSLAANGTYSDTVVTIFQRSVSLSDSFVSFRIDPLVRKWVAAGTDAPNGIVLIPDTAVSTLIAGSMAISNVETRPSLTVFYRDTADTTIQFTTLSAQRTTVANCPPPSPITDVITQAGVSYRGLIRFGSFKVPPLVSITQATLELTLDETASIRNTLTRDSMSVFLLMTNALPYDSLALGTLCVPQLYTNGGHLVYRADVKSIVQLWATREPNYGILVRPYGEFLTFDRFAVFGASAADTTLRPKLTIKFTQFQ